MRAKRELVVVPGRPGELRPLLCVRHDLLEIAPEEREDCPSVRDRREPDAERLLSSFRGDGARFGTFEVAAEGASNAAHAATTGKSG